jgi:hypothetical protein
VRLALISIAICAWPALAEAGTTRLTMQWVNGENIHLADQRGAINRHADIKIELELRDGGKLAGKDGGTSSEHNLYESYTTDEESTWKNTWSGTWTMRGPAAARELVLDLALDARACTRTRRETGVAPKTSACGPVSKQVQLACTTEQITVETWTGTKRSVARHAAWRCAPSGTVDLDETPRVWVLGKSTCLQTAGGRGGPSYQRCKP